MKRRNSFQDTCTSSGSEVKSVASSHTTSGHHPNPLPPRPRALSLPPNLNRETPRALNTPETWALATRNTRSLPATVCYEYKLQYVPNGLLFFYNIQLLKKPHFSGLSFPVNITIHFSQRDGFWLMVFCASAHAAQRAGLYGPGIGRGSLHSWLRMRYLHRSPRVCTCIL
jgi:hypothetical protein